MCLSQEQATGTPACPATSTRTPPELSVVVPCFNEEAVLDELHRRLTAAVRGCIGDSYEIILVNDGSRDRTWELIQELAARDPHVTGICLSRNYGHQQALSAGLERAVGGLVLIIDADLQDPPELLPDMMARLAEGADVVYGQRRHRHQESWFKKTSAEMFYRLLDALSEVAIPRDTGDFRLMRRCVLDGLLAMPERHRFVRGMVVWVGFTQVPLLYDRDGRYAGTTKYTLSKMVNFAADAITSFSMRPLRFSLYVSLGMACLAMLCIAYALFSWIFLNTVPGWTSLSILLMLFMTVQFLVLGVMGEYVGRIYMQTKQRPLFLIREITRKGRVDADKTEKGRAP